MGITQVWPLGSLEARQGEQSTPAPVRCGSDTGGTTQEQLPGIVLLLLPLPSIPTAGNALGTLRTNSISFPTLSQQCFQFQGASALAGARGPGGSPTPSAGAWLWHSRLLAIPPRSILVGKAPFPLPSQTGALLLMAPFPSLCSMNPTLAR